MSGSQRGGSRAPALVAAGEGTSRGDANQSVVAPLKDQMNIVFVGHVDHGKSTVVGRLLADTESLPQGKLDAVRKECQRTGKPFEFAFLLDALADEQDQGITIDTARCFFKTNQRDYIIIDAPGHIEFLKNMISGAARAEAAVLVIDAREGVRENSRRHGYILSMLGICQVVVCVNKMDLVSWSRDHFRKIEKEYGSFLADIGAVTPTHFIPVAAIHGVNLAARSTEMSWYEGPTLLESLDGFANAPTKVGQALRMPVQAVYKFGSHGDNRRIIAGRIEAGRVKVGDTVIFSPSGKSATIKTIEAFNAQARTEIEAGWSTGFTLSEEIFVRRGDVASHADKPPRAGTRFRANLIWLGKEPLTEGRDYKLKLGTVTVPVRVHRIHKVIDASEVDSELAKSHVGRHDVADLVLETRSPIAFDLIGECEVTGRFVIVDGYDVAGGGIIVAEEPARADSSRDARLQIFSEAGSGVPPAERVRRYGHGAALIVFVGKDHVATRRYACALERALFTQRRNVYLLNGADHLRGTDGEFPFSDDIETGVVRRVAEAAFALLEAGLLVISTTNVLGPADDGILQALEPHMFRIIVEVDPSGESAGPHDVSIQGSRSEDEVAAMLVETLATRRITLHE